jgi:hypothetical protein
MPAKTPSKPFIIAFGVTFLLIFAWNLFSYLHLRANPPEMDWYEECGFPFSFYGLGGFVGIDQFLWLGLVANYVFALALSVFAGFVCDRVYSGSRSKETRL